MEVGGADLFVRERPGAAPPILFVHGLGACSRSWDEAFDRPALAAHHLVAFDLPGFGRSGEEPDGRYDLRHLGGVVAEVAARTCSDARPLLVGHSMGGDIVTCLAEVRPEVCRGVVNLDGSITRAELFVSGLAAEAGDGFRYWYVGFQDTIRQMSTTHPPLERYVTSLAEARPQAFQRAAESIVALTRERWMGLRFAALTLPRVFIAAQRSSSPEGLALLRDHGQELVVLDCEHWLMQERPDAVYARVARAAA